MLDTNIEIARREGHAPDVEYITGFRALAGDRVEMRDTVVFIDGEPALYDVVTELRETLAPGVQVDALRSIEQLGGRRHAVQFLLKT